MDEPPHNQQVSSQIWKEEEGEEPQLWQPYSSQDQHSFGTFRCQEGAA